MRWQLVAVLVVLCGCKSNEGSTKDTDTGTTTQRPPGCGDGVLQGLEVCDGITFALGASCDAYGLGAGTVACAADCTLDFSACTSPDWCEANSAYGDGVCDPCDQLGGRADADCQTACGADGSCHDRVDDLAGVFVCSHAGSPDPDCGECGNGVLEGNELCDGAVFVASRDDCQAYGFSGGELGCNRDCTPDFAGCGYCGNGRLDTGEACDGGAFGGATCASYGFDSGALTCQRCAVVTSACTRSTRDYRALANAYCDLATRCESTLGRTVADRASCVTAFSAAFACDDNGMFPNQAAVDSCSQAIANAACDFGAVLNAFGQCGSGTAGFGEACDQHGCQPGLYCDYQVTDQSLCASCNRFRGIDENCADDAACVFEAYCDGSHCVRRKADSQACEHGGQCASLYCDNGFCRALPGANQPCTSEGECGGFRVCINGTCVERQNDGATCDDDDQCLLTSACEGTCQPDTACAPDAALGDSCDDFEECGGIGYCDELTGRCAAFKDAAAPCADDEECAPDHFCDFVDEICAPRAAVNASCEDAECVQEAYCDFANFPLTCRAKVPNGSPCPNSEACLDPDANCNDGICGYYPACTP